MLSAGIWAILVWSAGVSVLLWLDEQEGVSVVDDVINMYLYAILIWSAGVS